MFEYKKETICLNRELTYKLNNISAFDDELIAVLNNYGKNNWEFVSFLNEPYMNCLNACEGLFKNEVVYKILFKRYIKDDINDTSITV